MSKNQYDVRITLRQVGEDLKVETHVVVDGEDAWNPYVDALVPASATRIPRSASTAEAEQLIQGILQGVKARLLQGLEHLRALPPRTTAFADLYATWWTHQKRPGKPYIVVDVAMLDASAPVVEGTHLWLRAGATAKAGDQAVSIITPNPGQGGSYALQAAKQVFPGELLVLYMGSSGRDTDAWARPMIEFTDGRFTPAGE